MHSCLDLILQEKKGDKVRSAHESTTDDIIFDRLLAHEIVWVYCFSFHGNDKDKQV